MKRLITTGLFLCIAVSSLASEVAAQTLSLRKNQVFRVSDGPLCGFIESKNRWRPVQRVGRNFRVVRNPSDENRSACAELLKPSSRRSLSQLPAADEILSSASNGGLSSSLVSGTPPAFPQIVSDGGANHFWRSGVVEAIASGTPTSEQCSEFYSSDTDGASGGYGACYLAEGTGYAISEIAVSGTTLCYMRNFPPAAAEDSELVRVISGSLPEGGVRNIFNPPQGSRARVIRIRTIGDEEGSGPLFIRVYSDAQNAAQGNQYRADFWACDNGVNAPPQEAQQFRLNAGGELVATSVNESEGQKFTSTVRGFLRRAVNGLEFDPERGRSALYGGGNDEPGTERNFKSRVEINGDNEIRHWLRDEFGSNYVRTGYSASRFDGDGLITLRFYEGAFKEAVSSSQDGNFEYGGATEFRGSFYAAAPDNQYSSEAEAIDFSNDSFFQEDIELPTISSTQFSCSQEPDLSITLDMSRSSMQAVAAECEAGRVDGQIQFCQSEQLIGANDRYSSVCGD